MRWRKKKWQILAVIALMAMLVSGYIFRYVLLIQADPVLASKYLCRRFAYYSLNNPKSADFMPIDSFASAQKGKRFNVKGGVRATNAFNAIIYQDFWCEFHREGYGLILDDLRFGTPGA